MPISRGLLALVLLFLGCHHAATPDAGSTAADPLDPVDQHILRNLWAGSLDSQSPIGARGRPMRAEGDLWLPIPVFSPPHSSDVPEKCASEGSLLEGDEADREMSKEEELERILEEYSALSQEEVVRSWESLERFIEYEIEQPGDMSFVRHLWVQERQAIEMKDDIGYERFTILLCLVYAYVESYLGMGNDQEFGRAALRRKARYLLTRVKESGFGRIEHVPATRGRVLEELDRLVSGWSSWPSDAD